MQKREQQIKDLTNKGTPSCLFVSHNFVVESTLYFILKLAEVDFYPVLFLLVISVFFIVKEPVVQYRI